MSRARLHQFVITGIILVASACTDAAASTTQTEETSPASSSTTNTASASTVVERTHGPVPDYAALVAAVESAMAGTGYEGVAREEPEVFIATAELFCDLLDEGMTTEELLSAYLDRLSDGGTVAVGEDDGRLADVLLGAAVEIVCPDRPSSTS